MRLLRTHGLAVFIIGAGTAAAVAAARQRLYSSVLPYVDVDRLVVVPGARVTYAQGDR